MRDESFGNPIARKKFDKTSSLYEVELNQTKKINCIVLNEDIASGQQIKTFTIHCKLKNKAVTELRGNTIGKKRILTFPETETDSFIVTVDEAKATPLLSEVSAYLIDDNLIEKP